MVSFLISFFYSAAAAGGGGGRLCKQEPTKSRANVLYSIIIIVINSEAAASESSSSSSSIRTSAIGRGNERAHHQWAFSYFNLVALFVSLWWPVMSRLRPIQQGRRQAGRNSHAGRGARRPPPIVAI
jgi:hypothetical protein